jgi:hypothetical protein
MSRARLVFIMLISALALSTAALARICRGARLQLNEATANVPVPNAAPSVVLSFTLESRCQICQSLSYASAVSTAVCTVHV